MSKATRKANAEARRIIKYTRKAWNPAQVEAWRGGYGSPAVAAWERAHVRRGRMCLDFVLARHDSTRLRRALRAAEVKG